MLKRILPLLILIMAIPTMVMAQITTSSMTGTIKNATDEPLVGATITAIHQPTGTKYVTTSRSGGAFTINNMRVGGPYTVEISFVGFVTDKQEDLYLKLAEPFLLNTSLKSSSGELTNVVVTTSARRNPILNANRNGAVTNLSRVQIERLPTISRSVNDLTRATPQAGNSGTFGGGNYRQNNFTIDGADFNNSFGIGGNLPANGAPISVDALEEISVNITPYDIRQSGFIGSAINAVTRSGTNNFSGSVYKYFRTEKQRGDKVSSTKFIRPAEEFDMFGVRVGGPIIKNKLFFFMNYEKEEQPKSIQTRFAATPSLPYGPSNPNVAKPTAAELDNISQYLLNTYGYVTGPYDNYTTVIERKKIMARLDWNISQKHKLNLRYSQVEGGEPNPPSTSRSPLTGYATSLGRTTENAMWFKNSNYFQGANFYSFAAELNSSFKRVSNTFRATYTFQNDSRTTESQIFPFVDILDGTVAATDVSQTGIPFASFGHEPFSFGNLRKVKMYSFVDNLTWTTGKHNWTAGIQADLSQTINGFQRFATSYYTFASWNDFITGQKPKDFAITYSLAPGYAQSFPSFKFAQYSIYGQDEIVASKNLRLTFGLRLDQPGYPDVDEVKTHPLVASLTFANGEKINTGVLPKKRLMWSPRFGFNWDFYGDRSMQFRGGTGIFTGRIPFVWIVSQSTDAQMLQATRTFIGQANTPGPFNPDPAAYRPATVPTAGTFIGNPISAMDPDFKIPQTWKTSLAMDVKLFGGIVATIEAIYNKDLNTAVFRNPNLVNPSPLNVTGYPDNRMIYPSSNTQKFINPLTSAGLPSSTGTAALNTIVMDNGSKGYYFSLTAQLQKQFRGGFFASVAYTKSMADNLFDGNGDQPLSAWQGTANVNGSNFASLGYAGFVIPDRVIANFSYRKEYFKHLGTTISLFYEGGIGGRFSYVYSADFNRDGTNLDLIYIPTSAQVQQMRFANLTVNGTTYDQAAQRNLFENYILQDKYLSKHRGQYAERNGAQIPWRNQVDVRLLQDVFTNIGKNKNTLQFSIDVFNFGNLLNPSWGKQKTINASAILVPTNVTSLTPGGTTVPEFRLATANGAVVTNTFRDNVSVFSTYYMQFGLRYIFGN